MDDSEGIGHYTLFPSLVERRERIATAFGAGILANKWGWQPAPESVAQESVRQADALIAELDKKEP